MRFVNRVREALGPRVLLAARRWLAPMISVVFASGLQLSGAVQQTLGWTFMGLAVVLSCAYVIIERRTEPKEADMANAGDTNINYGQQGIGINRGIVNVGAPQVKGSCKIIAENQQTDEGYVTTAAIHLEHPYAGPSLAVLVNLASVKEMRVFPVNGGVWATTDIRSESGQQGVLVDPPLVSDYRAEVVTEQPHQGLVFDVRLDISPPNT